MPQNVNISGLKINPDGSINVLGGGGGGGGGGSVVDSVQAGTLSATSGANSTVTLALGTGQATWEAQFTGTFSTGTTIAFQGSDDASSPTNWRSAVGYDTSLTSPTAITSISGPGPYIIRGTASGYQYFQVVCTALHTGDSVAVRLIGTTGAIGGSGSSGGGSGTNASVSADGSPIPLSSTLIGASDGTSLQPLQVESSTNKNLRTGIYSGANEATVTGANALKVDNSAVTQPISGTVSVNALPTGTNVIGHVIVDSANSVAISTLPTLPTGTNVIGHVIVDSAGSVSITSLPSLPAGTNTIGNVGLVAGSALAGGFNVVDSAGTNKLAVDASGNASIKVGAALPTGTNVIGHVIVDSAGSVTISTLPALPSGTNVIGHVIVDSASSVAVTSLPALPTGTNTVGNVGIVAGTALIGSVELTDSAGTNKATISAAGAIKVDNSGVTQPVSAATLPLPTGASTSAKQPALGTAGTASSDVLSVQGITSMTPLKTDGSAVTQPISGSITANAGTNLNTSTLALESGGHLASIDTHIPAKGQTTMSASTPVTIASDQTAIPISGSITATNPSVSTTASAVPGSATYIAGNKSGNVVGLALDGSGNLNVNVQAGGTGGNAAVGTTGSTVPASATYIAGNKSGNMSALVLDSSGNLNVNVQAGGIGNNASVGTDGSAIPTSSTLIGASDGTNLQQLTVESASNRNLRTGIYSGANEATVTGANALKVDNSAVTQPVSGSVTATTNADTTIGGTTAPSKELLIGGKTNDATAQYQPIPEGPGGRSVIIEGIAGGTAIPISGNITATNPSVSTDGSALPTSSTLIGASDGTNLQQLLVESTTNRNLRTGIYSGANEATVTGANALKVDNSAVTQPVSAATLPLPTGAATSAKQSAPGTAGTASSDVLSVQGITSMTPLKVDASATTQPVSGTVSVNALPTGTNTVGNVGLVAGSALIGSVELTDSAGTNKAAISASGAIKVDNSGVTQPVSGAITANVGTTNGIALDTSVNGVIVAQGSATSGEKGPMVQGAVTTGAPTYTTAQTSPISLTTAGAVRVDNSAVTQPISAASLPLSTGAATSAKQPTLGTAGTASSDVLSIQGIASMTPLKTDGSATTQPISGTVTANAGSGSFTVAQATGSNLHVVNDAGAALIGGVQLTDSGGTNKASISAGGAVKVDNSAVTQPVSGTVTSTTNADTTIGSTTAPSKELLIGGKTNDATPQYQPLPEGAGGRSVIVEGIAGGVAIPISGSITATNPSVGTDGSAIPTSSTLLGASDGTNLQQLLVESSTNRNLRTGIYSGANEATVTGANALKVDGSATTQPISGTITANVGTTNGVALDTSVNGVIVSQGSTTSGEKGPLIQGAVTTASPTYTTAQTSPISLTTAGAVRVDASSTTQPISGTIAATQSGTWTVQPGNTPNTTAWKVDNSGVTQPVSAATLPLPTGASTSAKQPALGTAGTASSDVLSVQGVTSMTPLKVDGSGVTQPVSGTVSVNALPTGTNTVGNVGLVAGSALIGSIELTDSAGTNKAAISAAGAIKVDNSAVTQPVSGTITANVGTTNGIALDTSVNGVIVAQGSTTSGEKGPLVQGAVTTASPTYTTAQTSPISLTTAGAVRVDASATTQPVSAASLPLPTGAATSAKQPALGTAGTASSDVLSIQGITSMTPLKTDGSATTQPVSGTITANAGTGNFTVAQATGSNLHVVNDAGAALIGGVQLTDSAGTNKASVDASGNQYLRGNFTEQASLSANALNAFLVPSTDVSAYKWLSLQITGTFVGTVTFSASNDGTNFQFVALAACNGPTTSSSPVFSTSGTGLFERGIGFRYFQAKVTAYTSGPITGTLELYTHASGNSMQIWASQEGTWTSATNADTAIGGTTAPAKELLIGGKTNDATPQYQPLPEGPGGRSVIIEGVSGGTAIPISGSITATNPSVSTTAAAVPGSATYIGANKSGNVVGLALDGSGNLNVNVQAGGIGSNASVGTDGSAIPTSSTMIGASDGTNLQQLIVESATNRNLRTGIYSGTNEATVTGANALKVDGSAVNQPISGSPDLGTTLKILKTANDGTLATNATLQAGSSVAGIMMDYRESVARGLVGSAKYLTGKVAIGTTTSAAIAFHDQNNATYTTVTTGKTLYIASIDATADTNSSDVLQTSLMVLTDGTNPKYQFLASQQTPIRALPIPVTLASGSTLTVTAGASNSATGTGFLYVSLTAWEE